VSDGLAGISSLVAAAYDKHVAAMLARRPLFEPDPAWQAEQKAKRKALAEAALARWQEVCGRATSESIEGKILELHKPDASSWGNPECEGCGHEVSGYEYDMEEWPCATFRLIEEAL
jgi:hypothetical protein